MDDQYDYFLEEGERFFIGVKHDSHTKIGSATYLFQNLRIVRITAGSAEWVIADTPYFVESGDIIFFNNIAARKITRLFKEPFQYDLYAFSPSFVHEDGRFLSLFYNKNKASILKKGSPHIEECYNSLSQISQAILSNGGMGREILPTLIRLTLLYCIQAVETKDLSEPYESMNLSKVIADLCYDIQTHPEADLSTASLAKTVNFSRGYLSTVFKQCTGITLKEYVNLRRLEYACKLISEGQCSILDAAFQSGFQSSSGFYKTFIRMKGMPPRQYFKNR